jgi:hypothetical protein
LTTNLDKYRGELDKLISNGEDLLAALTSSAYGKEFEKVALKRFDGDQKKATDYLKALPDFNAAYQNWYSEALVVVKQLLSDRLADFVGHYEKPKGRKELNPESYRIADALQGLSTSRAGTLLTDSSAAVSHVQQQVAILKSVQKRFDSSLFEIKQLVQADLFDSELDSASELLKNKYVRAAGAIAGVVLEKHLLQVCDNHGVKVTKSNPSISDLNDQLKGASVIDVPAWRFNQHLADLRNLCDHKKTADPTKDQVQDLLDGVAKVIKTLY